MRPCFPNGATLPSILAANAALNQPVPNLGETNSLLGFHAAEIARAIGAGEVDAATLIAQHSLANILLALRTPSEACELWTEMKAENHPQRTLMTRMWTGFTLASRVRRCPECAREDLARFGWVFARAIHQLLPVRECLVHGCALEDACAECGQPLWEIVPNCTAQRNRQMLARCAICGGERGRPFVLQRCAGRRDVQHLFDRCLRNPFDCRLQPAARLHLVERLAAWAAHSATDLEQQFAAYWGANGFKEACSEANASCRQLTMAMRGDKVPYDPYTCIALAAFAHWVLPPAELVRNASVNLPDERGKDGSLVAAARQQGLPWGAVQLYLKGRTVQYLDCRGWPRHAIASFLNSLPDHQRESLMDRHKNARFSRGNYEPAESEEYLAGIRERYREQAKRAVIERGARTRVRLRHLARKATSWLEKDDADWLEKLVPSQRAAAPDLPMRRGNVLELLQSMQCCPVPHCFNGRIRVRNGVEARGIRSAGYYTLLERMDAPLYRWMIANDSEWFHTTVEARIARDAAARRGWQFDRLAVLSHRNALGLNRTQYGSLVGVCRSTVLRWEIGKKKPRPAQRKAIGNLFTQMPVENEEWKAAYEAAQRFNPLTGLVHRLALGLSRPQYAKLIGVDRHCVFRWETGQAVPSPEHRKAIDELASGYR